MQRYDYLKAIAPEAGDALAVCTGWGAREWWAVRPGDGNLKTRTLEEEQNMFRRNDEATEEEESPQLHQNHQN